MNIVLVDFPEGYEMPDDVKQRLWDEEQRNYQAPMSALRIRYIDGVDFGFAPDFSDVPFQRIRRITGYLVGDTTRWNNAKYSELKDRLMHGS